MRILIETECSECGTAVITSPWPWDTKNHRRGSVICDECRDIFDARHVLPPEAHDDSETPEIW